MAFSFSTPLFVSLLLAFLFTSLSSARPTVKATNDLISEICPKTRNPSYCSTALRSDRRSAGADLRGLGQISIDLSQRTLGQISNLIASLSKQATNPKQKEAYKTCTEIYSEAKDDLDSANKSLNAGDYRSLNIEATAAFDSADTCEDSLRELQQQPPKQLQQADEKFRDLASTILAISVSL